MVEYQQDKLLGFTQSYTEQFKHKCGTCFSNGLVDTGIALAPNDRLVYVCPKCVRQATARQKQGGRQ